MKKISTKRAKPFKTANFPASLLLPVHFNWLFDVIRELLTIHYITFIIELENVLNFLRYVIRHVIFKDKNVIMLALH